MVLFSKLASRLRGAKPRKPRFPDIVAFRETVMAAARREPGAQDVVASPSDPAKFELKIGDRSATGDVTNIFGHLNAYPDEDADVAIGRLMRSITEPVPETVKADHIVVVIRSRDYLEHSKGLGMDIFHEPLGADLAIVYMIDRPDSMVPLLRKNMEGLDVASLRVTALTNVRNHLTAVSSDDRWKIGVLYFVEGNTMLSTSLLLVDEFWAAIAGKFPGDVLIALPRRDQLFLFEDGNPDAKALARRLIDATIKENFNLLSPHLYARRGGNIVLVED